MAFAFVVNAAIVVTQLLVKERHESTAGTGLDDSCSKRIRSKAAYPLLRAMAKIILKEFGLLIVVCNHGRHRSVALANDIAIEEGATLIAPCSRHLGRKYHMTVASFIECMAPGVEAHIEAHGWRPFPIRSLGVVLAPWDGIVWARNNGTIESDYHVLHEGGIVIECTPNRDPQGWLYAYIWEGGAVGHVAGWLPPTWCDHSQTIVGVPRFEVVMCMIRSFC